MLIARFHGTLKGIIINAISLGEMPSANVIYLV
jgi:hypothetical protein